MDLILSEDTRKTSILLKKYTISTPCHSFDKFSEGKKVQTYIEKLKKGANIAIISECGTPNISDPGSYIVRKCLENELPITPIAGPSAVSTLISVSGTNCNQFIFGGFFPKKSNEALSIFNQNNKNNWPILFFDTGKRIIKNLEWLNTTIQCEQITIGKELTKTFETILAGTLEHVIETLSDQSLKGEWCYLLEKPSVKTSIQLTQLIEIGKEMNPSEMRIENAVPNILMVGVYFLCLNPTD